MLSGTQRRNTFRFVSHEQSILYIYIYDEILEWRFNACSIGNPFVEHDSLLEQECTESEVTSHKAPSLNH